MPLQKKTYLLFILLIAIFSTNFIFTKQIIPPLTPPLFFLLRSIIGVILIGIIVKGQNKSKDYWICLKKDYKGLLIFSIIFYTIPNLILYYGTQYTTATNQVIIQNFNLVIVVCLNFILYKKKPQKNILIAAVITTSGTFLILWPFNLSSNVNLFGDILSLIGVALGAMFTIKQKHYATVSEPLFIALLLSSSSILLLLPIVLWEGSFGLILELSILQWCYLLWLGIGISSIGYVVYQLIYQDHGMFPELMGIFGALTITVGAFISIYFFGETLGVINIIGAILVISAIYLAQKPIDEKQQPNKSDKIKKSVD